MAKNENKEFYKIEQHIATLSDKEGFTKEFNLIQYEALKHTILDIRKCDNTGDIKKMGKGITITEEEAKKLLEALQDYFKEDIEA